MDLKLIYINDSGTCIVMLKDGLFYYGNGEDLNMYGRSPMKFLRFNPYLKYVGDDNMAVPEAVAEWIRNNAPKE